MRWGLSLIAIVYPDCAEGLLVDLSRLCRLEWSSMRHSLCFHPARVPTADAAKLVKRRFLFLLLFLYIVTECND